MKKHLLIFILPLLAILSSCQKVPGTQIGVTAVVTGTYQPFTANSYWKYTATTGTTTSTSVTTMGATTATFNSKLYHTCLNTSSGSTAIQTGYFSNVNNFYSARSTSTSSGVTVTLDFTYLNDALPVGGTWTVKATDDGLVNGVPCQTVGTIMEKGISKIVSGTTFTNVIHSRINLQYNYGLGKGFETATVYDYYVAFNVGVIECDTQISTLGVSLTSTSILTDYSIK